MTAKTCFGQDSSTISSKVRGTEGTSVVIGISRDGEIQEFTLTRESIKMYHVESKMLEDDIGYILLYTFDDGCSEEFEAEMDSLISQGAKKIILDLRINSGGVVDEALNIIDLFVDKDQTVLIEKYANGDEEVIKSESDKKYDVSMVILTSGYTASASEIVIGALSDLRSC